MIQIKLAQKSDLPKCAKILKDTYNNNVLNEGWTEESSIAICDFYFKINPDLFFVATRGVRLLDLHSPILNLGLMEIS